MIARRKFLAWLGLAPVAAVVRPAPTAEVLMWYPTGPTTLWISVAEEVWDTPINANAELLDLIFNSTLSGPVTITG